MATAAIDEVQPVQSSDITANLKESSASTNPQKSSKSRLVLFGACALALVVLWLLLRPMINNRIMDIVKSYDPYKKLMLCV